MPVFNQIKIYTNQLAKVLAHRHSDLSFNDIVAVGAIAGRLEDKLEFNQWQDHIRQSISNSKSGTTINRVYE